ELGGWGMSLVGRVARILGDTTLAYRESGEIKDCLIVRYLSCLNDKKVETAIRRHTIRGGDGRAGPPAGGRGRRGWRRVHGGKHRLPPGAAPCRRRPPRERPRRRRRHGPQRRPGAPTLRSPHRDPTRPGEPRVLSPFRERDRLLLRFPDDGLPV